MSNFYKCRITPQSLFRIFLLLVVLIFIIELSGFSDIFLYSTQLHHNDYPSQISIIYPKNSIHSNSTSDNRPQHSHNDWFDAQKWPKKYCPHYENICMYNQKLRVFNSSQQFYFKAEFAQKVFGDHMPKIKETLPIYLNVLNATVWNHDQHEYEQAQCTFHKITNHMIMHGYFQTMLGEWYTRVLAEMYRFYYHKADRYTINQDIKLYLFIGDQAPIYTAHHLFLQPFTNYNVAHFTNLIERIDCNCYKRLIFCGFIQKYDDQTGEPYLHALDRMTLDNDDDAKRSSSGRYAANLPLYPLMIEFYNKWVNDQDINIHRDINQWKVDTLKQHLNSDDIVADEWFFIGFYQRNYRRTWLFLETEILPKCNAKYNKYKIYCDSINLEEHLHPRDVVLMHRSHDMLIGIHGAHLTDAIWLYDPMNVDINKYIIELLPTNGPSWTSSLHIPTALGIIFWQSKLNHVGFKLGNESISAKDWKRGRARWYKSDFKVNWKRLSGVIDYLIIDEGGMCNKYHNKSQNIKVPASFQKKKYRFAIYNAFCNRNPSGDIAWNYAVSSTKQPGKCKTCSSLRYDTYDGA